MSIQEDFKLDLEIIPSPGTQILDWNMMAEKIEQVKPFARVIHIDLLDGKFAPNTTSLDPKPFTAFTKDSIFEAHLMVENPLQYVNAFAAAGFRRFIGQIEKMPDIPAFIAKAESFGEVGLAVDSQTPVDTIFPFVEDLDFVLIMTVKAGFSNQQFLPNMLSKVKALRGKVPWLPIELDGGMTDQTIRQAKEAGATRFVSTGFLFAHPEENYKKLHQAIFSET